MVCSATFCVCVCGIQIGIQTYYPSDINNALITIFYTNLNSADADAKSRWTPQKAVSVMIRFQADTVVSVECDKWWRFSRVLPGKQSPLIVLWSCLIIVFCPLRRVHPEHAKKKLKRVIVMFLYPYHLKKKHVYIYIICLFE